MQKLCFKSRKAEFVQDFYYFESKRITEYFFLYLNEFQIINVFFCFHEKQKGNGKFFHFSNTFGDYIHLVKWNTLMSKNLFYSTVVSPTLRRSQRSNISLYILKFLEK